MVNVVARFDDRNARVECLLAEYAINIAMVGVRLRFLVPKPRPLQLPHNPVERRGHDLRSADVVILTGLVPEHDQRSALRAVRQKHFQSEADWHRTDRRLTAGLDRAAQDLHSKLDRNSLATVHPAMERNRNNNARGSRWHAAGCALATTTTR
jgi:hypothetical protein